MRAAAEIVLTAMLCGAGPLQAESIPSAVIADPPLDKRYPASMVAMQIQSHGAPMNAVLYLAAGAGPHPAFLLFHGLPGNEQNLDLAQAVRRAGFSVLTLHYRGSWGSGGTFALVNALEDSQAALDFLRDPQNAARYRLDPERIVLGGHSMGGFMAASTAANNPDVSGLVLIAAWNPGRTAVRLADPKKAQEWLERLKSDVPPLAGATPQSLLEEVRGHGSRWDAVENAARLKSVPTLLVRSDDGLGADNAALAAALREAGNDRVAEIHLATDHSFSDRRIALQAAVIRWLTGLVPTNQPRGRISAFTGR